MSKVLVLLLQLSALMPVLLGQHTFDNDFYKTTESGFGFDSSYGYNSYRGIDDQESSYSFQQPTGPEPFDNGYLNERHDFANSPRQFPFFNFYPQQQFFPQFPSGINFDFPQFKPWWQGDNVCVTKDESTEEWTGNEVGLATQPDYSINLQTCVEQGANEYICKTTTNRGGKKLVVVSTRRCCKGYARFPQRHGPSAQCVQVEMVSFQEAAKKYGYSDFLETLKMANITQDQVEQSTLLLPLKMAVQTMSADNDTSTEMNELENSIVSEDVLEYLIPNKTIDLEIIENETVFKAESGHSVRFNVYPRMASNVSDDYDYKYYYTANCVPILLPKIFSTQGMILGLDRKLIISEMNLTDLMAERDDLSMFSQMMESMNFSQIIDSQDGFTILAPNDEAFANLSSIEQRMLLSGDECASEYISNHILGLTMCSGAVVKNAKAHVQNVLKRTITFERDEQDEMVINQKSRVVEMDLVATNGVLHIIDRILPSDSFMTVVSLLENRNSSVFADLMTKSGFAEQFEDLRGVTFFVPTDEAMKNHHWKRVMDSDSGALVKNASLYEFLSNHIVSDVIGSHDFRSGAVRTMAKQNLSMNIFINQQSRGATLNCARFVSTDGVSCNRAVHQIDRAMEIPSMTILEALKVNKDYSMFYGMIKKANMTAIIGNNSDYTLLVPTNDVFEEQTEYYQELMASMVDLVPFLKMHIIPNQICCSSFPKYPAIHTVQTANGVPLSASRNRRPMLGNAHITKCDILLKNGSIFEVNDIIEFSSEAHRGPYYK